MTYARKARTAKEMTEIERAWVGAFIEADGTVFATTQASGRTRRFTIGAVQLEIDPIATLLRVTGVGSVSRVRNGEGRNPVWRWIVGAYEDALSIAEQCAPYSWKLQRILPEFARKKGQTS